MAPGDEATLLELRSKRPQAVVQELPEAVRSFCPTDPVDLDRKVFLEGLRSAPKGSSPGPGGGTYEHLKVMLDEEDDVELLFEAAASFAKAELPTAVAEALMLARLTALRKESGGVRGIATGTSMRRLVARALA